METSKQNNQIPPLGANVPEWVMHLLTGMGTMGAEYMLFIKPLQEKVDLQKQLLDKQNERIKRLENALKSMGLKLPSYSEDSDDEDDDGELFKMRYKPSGATKQRKYTQFKF